jgi:hypothetical protein
VGVFVGRREPLSGEVNKEKDSKKRKTKGKKKRKIAGA